MPFILRNSFVYLVRRGNSWLGFRAFIYDSINIRPQSKTEQSIPGLVYCSRTASGSRVTPVPNS